MHATSPPKYFTFRCSQEIIEVCFYVTLGREDKQWQTTKVYQLRMLFFMKCALQELTGRLYVTILLLPALVPYGHIWVYVRIFNNCYTLLLYLSQYTI